MKSIDKFLSFRRNCPFCERELMLITREGPNATLSYGLKDNRYLILKKNISGWRLSNYNYSFDVEISLDTLLDKFFVDFLDKEGSAKNVIPINHLEKYLNYFKHKKDTISFERKCDRCNAYKYNSNSFFFDFHTARLHPIITTEETFFFEETKNVYIVEQDYLEKETNIYIYDNSAYIEQMRDVAPDVWNYHVKEYQHIKIPLYDFEIPKMRDQLETILMLS